MAIRNQDGSSFRVSGSLQQFDPENVEHDLFNVWDQEVIEIGGSPLYYYDVFINMNTVDRLYMEDRGKIFSQTPICIYGYYDPVPSHGYQSMFGMISQDEIMFEFNYKHVLQQIGHAPKVGARIYSPHKGENWMVTQRNVEVFKLWGELRLQVMCERFTETLTTGEGRVSQPVPDFSVNDIRDIPRNPTQGCR